MKQRRTVTASFFFAYKVDKVVKSDVAGPSGVDKTSGSTLTVAPLYRLI